MADASSSSSSSLPMTFNISNFFSSPMDRTSYLSWRSQFEDILDIHDLKHVVDPASPIPLSSLPDSSPNPAYPKWLKSDKLVLSWIKATLSSSLKPLLFPCKTASEAWILLEKRLSPLSKSHVRTLRDQLRSLKKDPDQSVADYLLNAKSLSDSLASAGSSISESELIDSILDGLPHLYKEFVTSIHLRPSLTFDDFYDLILQEELLQKKMSAVPTSNANALVVSHYNNKQYSGGKHKGRGRGRGRGGGRGSHLPPDSRPPLLPTPSSISPFAACQICNKLDHTARLCPQRGNFAYVAQQLSDAVSHTHISEPADPNWCLDSGATHHMTPTASSLTESQPYQGNDTIIVGLLLRGFAFQFGDSGRWREKAHRR